MSLQLDDLLNERYRIQEIIAEGGMGAIYRAFDLSLNIQVALKENYRDTDIFARQFRREAALLAALNHPNLPRVTDYFISPSGGQYLVMDFVDGKDLRQILAETSLLPETEVVQIGSAVCDALNYLHTRRPPVIHRDIKPGNVKITPSGQVFLVDFGLAKQSAGGESTTTGAQALTPGYAPPEQYGQGTDQRTDIYALGATLYAALSGKIPEDGLARAMGTVELQPLLAAAPSVSPSLAQAIEKAMSTRPPDRYASAAEFRAALLGITIPAGNSIPAPSAGQPQQGTASASPTITRSAALSAPPVPVPTRKPARLALWLGLGFLGVVALGFVLLLVYQPKQPSLVAAVPSPSQIVPTQTSGDSPTPSSAPATSSSTASPTPTIQEKAVLAQPSPSPTRQSSPTPLLPTATPPGGSAWLAFSSDRDGSPQIWLISPGNGRLEKITNLPDGACQPDWSPDGQRLVFTSPCPGRRDTYPGSSLYLIRSDGTALVPLASIPGGDYDPAWSPDGTRIAFTSLRSGKPNIYLYDLATNKTSLLSNPVNYDNRPAWSPDGQWIAYETTSTGQPQIFVMNAEGKQKSEFSPSASGNSYMPAWAPDGSHILYSQGGKLPVLFSRVFPPKASPEIRLAETLIGVADTRLSPDGQQIALTLIDRSGASDLVIQSLANDGSAAARLTDAPGEDFHPAWRP